MGLVFSTSMQSFPIRTTGHDFLHSFGTTAGREGMGRCNKQSELSLVLFFVLGAGVLVR